MIDAKVALQALKTQQQVPTLRGGTLGIPSPDTSEGLQVMASGQAVTSAPDLPENRGFDLFAKLGGLELFDNVRIDLVAERYKQELPSADLNVTPMIPTNVLPRMVLGEVRDVGFRIRYHEQRVFDVETTTVTTRIPDEQTANVQKRTLSQRLDREDDFSLTAGMRLLQRSSATDGDTLDRLSGIALEAIGQLSLASTKADDPICARELQAKHDAANAQKRAAEKTKGDAIEKMKKADAKLNDLRTKVGTDDLTRRLDEVQTSAERDSVKRDVDAADVQVKKADAQLSTIDTAQNNKVCTTVGYRVMGFLGLAATHLHSEAIHTDTTNVENPLFDEAKLTLGVDVQSLRIVDGAPVLPRVGAYVSLAKDKWHDRFAPIGAEANILGTQIEGAIYVCGHLISGFNALVSFVVLKPYGHDAPVQYVINIAPAVGATLGAK